MGGTPSGEVSSNYLKEFTQHYAFLKEQNDPRFGLIRVYKKRNSEEEVMVVKRMYSSDEEYDYFQRELNIRLNFQHKGLLHLLGYQRESNSNLCGHSRVFELYSEFHSHNLKKEIQKRSATQVFIRLAFLFYIFCLSIFILFFSCYFSCFVFFFSFLYFFPHLSSSSFLCHVHFFSISQFFYLIDLCSTLFLFIHFKSLNLF